MSVVDGCRHRRGLFGYSFLSCLAWFGRICCILETFVDQIETNFASKESEELSQHNA